MKEEAAHSSALEDTISTVDVESLGAGYLKGRSRSSLRPVPRKSLPDPKHLIHFIRVRVDVIQSYQWDRKSLRLFNVTKKESMEVLDLK